MFNQEAAKLERSWVSGLSWGFQLYAEWFEAKPGGILVVSQTIEPVQAHAVGPNQVIAPPRPSPRGTNATNVVTSPTLTPSLQLTRTDPLETQEPL